MSWFVWIAETEQVAGHVIKNSGLALFWIVLSWIVLCARTAPATAGRRAKKMGAGNSDS